jgi:hypothetical protein
MSKKQTPMCLVNDSLPHSYTYTPDAAEAMRVPVKYRVLGRPVVRIVGWFKPVVGEIYEMLYQNDSPYLFDLSKYTRAFGFQGTAYTEGIRATAASYGKAR